MSEAIELSQSSMELLEQVVVNGDLAKLSAPQRLDYYRQVCQSMGLNPLSRPLEYITLKGKLTLYAKKDATDQLRKINGVSIDDVDIQETQQGFRVKVKGHDRDGRSDVEIGCVANSDMGGNIQNAEMKAVTKAKRRLTLSLCGLGWLDETEIETIPDAQPVIVDSNGEIIEGKQKAVEAPKQKFDEISFLKQWGKPDKVGAMNRTSAESMVDDNGQPYGEKDTRTLWYMQKAIMKKIDEPETTAEQKEIYSLKLSAVCEILQCRKMEKTLPEQNAAGTY